jgi:GNAT superfamily N-acetyltransferase
VTREWSDWRCGWIWWFQSVYVAEAFRGRGVFRALFQHVRDSALAETDVIGLRLYVEHENSRALATYAALGMEPGGYHVYEQLWRERFGNS